MNSSEHERARSSTSSDALPRARTLSLRQVRAILGQIRPDRQAMLFSATFKPALERLARDGLTEPVRVAIGTAGDANEDVTQIIEVHPAEEPGFLPIPSDFFRLLPTPSDSFLLLLLPSNPFCSLPMPSDAFASLRTAAGRCPPTRPRSDRRRRHTRRLPLTSWQLHPPPAPQAGRGVHS